MILPRDKGRSLRKLRESLRSYNSNKWSSRELKHCNWLRQEEKNNLRWFTTLWTITICLKCMRPLSWMSLLQSRCLLPLLCLLLSQTHPRYHLRKVSPLKKFLEAPPCRILFHQRQFLAPPPNRETKEKFVTPPRLALCYALVLHWQDMLLSCFKSQRRNSIPLNSFRCRLQK